MIKNSVLKKGKSTIVDDHIDFELMMQEESVLVQAEEQLMHLHTSNHRDDDDD
jgi:hypothetical protein